MAETMRESLLPIRRHPKRRDGRDGFKVWRPFFSKICGKGTTRKASLLLTIIIVVASTAVVLLLRTAHLYPPPHSSVQLDKLQQQLPQRNVQWHRHVGGKAWDVLMGAGKTIREGVGGAPIRYITATTPCNFTGGFAKTLFRAVSLHAIGKALGRQPYFTESCYKEFVEKIAGVFPALSKRLQIIKPTMNETVVSFEWQPSATPICCRYEDPLNNSALVDTIEVYVRLYAYHLQHHRYFSGDEADMRQILSFAPALREKIGAFVDTMLIGDRDSHKLCVHGHRSSPPHPKLDSEVSFIEAAIRTVRSGLLGLFAKVSLMVITEGDKSLMSSLNFSSTQLSRIHFLREPLHQGELLYFAATYCDSLLITAPDSVFAWWMGYMMSISEGFKSRKGYVMYNADLSRVGKNPTGHYYRQRDYYPASWIPLQFGSSNASIIFASNEAIERSQRSNSSF